MLWKQHCVSILFDGQKRHNMFCFCFPYFPRMPFKSHAEEFQHDMMRESAETLFARDSNWAVRKGVTKQFGVRNAMQKLFPCSKKCQ